MIPRRVRIRNRTLLQSNASGGILPRHATPSASGGVLPNQPQRPTAALAHERQGSEATDRAGQHGGLVPEHNLPHIITAVMECELRRLHAGRQLWFQLSSANQTRIADWPRD